MDKQAADSKDTSRTAAPADQDRSWIELVKDDVLKPLGNSALVDSYNAVANGVNFVSKGLSGAELLSQKERWSVQEAKPYTADWVAQTAFRGLGSILPYTIAGRGMGGVMRGIGATTEAEGVALTLLKDQRLAYAGGAFAYDGLRTPEMGETRLGNALGGAAAIYTFGAGNRWAGEMGGLKGLATRIATPAAGAMAQLTASDMVAQQRLPDAQEIGQAAISAYILSPILPHAQRMVDRAIVSGQARTNWGAPLDLYAQQKMGADLQTSPTFKSVVDANPWARVKLNSQLSDYSLDGNRIGLSNSNPSAGEMTRQLMNLSDAKSGRFESQFGTARSLLLSGNTGAAWETFRDARANQQVAARFVESAVNSDLKGSPLFNPNTLKMEIGAWVSPGGVSNEFSFRQEFSRFVESEGEFRPGNTVENAKPFDPNPEAQKPARPMTEAEQKSLQMREAGTDLVRGLQKAGHLAAFAGGAVRDGVMGRTPKDFDIVTAAPPDVVHKIFQDLGYKVKPIGKHFGVVQVNVNGMDFEIATLRNDGESVNGRHPTNVKFVNSLYEDAARRDYTMNSMFEEPTTKTVFDFFNGKQDIAAKQIRAIGDPELRFSEDLLRMLRAPRFGGQLGFDVHPETLDAITKLSAEINRKFIDAEGNEKRAVAMDRVREELIKLFSGPDTLKGLQILEQSGLRSQLVPEYNDMFGPRAMQDPIYHPEGLASVHTEMVLSNLPPNAPWQVKFAAWLHDIAKPMTQEVHKDGRISNHKHDYEGAKLARNIVDRLMMSKADSDRIVTLVAEHMRMHEVRNFRPGKLNTLLTSPYFEDQVMLQHADATGTGHPDRMSRSNRDWLYAKKAEMENAPETQRPGAPLIVTGQFFVDLMKEAKIPAGPRRNEIRLEAQQAQAEGLFNDQQTARLWLDQNIPEFRRP